MEEISHHAKMLPTDIERMKRSDKISEENKDLILKFLDYLSANGMSEACQRQAVWVLSTCATILSKPFTEATKEDIIRLVGGIESKYDSEKSKLNIKSKLKQFYKWLRNSEDYPEEVKWIKIRLKNESNRKLPEELLTKEEVERLASAANNPRDRALVLVLYESGCRVSELLSLKIKNIQFDEYGCVLLVNGKTGGRRIRIIDYTKDLLNWLDLHPLKNDSNAYVWISLGKNTKNQLLSYVGVEVILRRLAERAGITKKVNPHSFRHARATHLAKNLPEAVMKEFFGWTQSSRMASIYYHLSGRDVDEALLKLHGLKLEENKELKPVTTRVCPRCGENNSILTQFCKKCFSPLDLKTAIEVIETRKNFDEFLFEFLKFLAEQDPKIKKTFVSLVKARNLEHMLK